jgi:hypothetical protein
MKGWMEALKALKTLHLNQQNQYTFLPLASLLSSRPPVLIIYFFLSQS